MSVFGELQLTYIALQFRTSGSNLKIDAIKTNFMKLQTAGADMFDYFKKNLGLVLPSDFVHDFLRKIFLMLYSLNWSNSIVWLPIPLETSGTMCIVILCYQVNDFIIFYIYLNFLLKLFSYTAMSQERKEVLRWNKKHFSSFLKDFQLPKNVSDLIVRF